MPNLPISTLAFPPDESASNASGQVSANAPTPPTPITGFGVEVEDFYLAFGVSVTNLWDSGLRVAPKAGVARSHNIVWRQHAEVGYKSITFVAARANGIPKVPHFDLGNSNDVLIARSISAPQPADMPDGTRAVTIYGVYLYFSQLSPALLDPIVLPANVFKIGTTITLDPSQFSYLLAGPVPAPPGFNGKVVNY